MKWRFSGRFFVYDSGKEGECGQGKENQSQLGRRDAKTGRMDGKGREGMNEWVERKRKRVRRRLDKRKSGIGKEGEEDWKRGRKGQTTCSLQSETGRDNLLTVLLCYQQKGSRY
ncbi:hypothetical protein I6E46_07720 [Prevotella loescheii]|nr:hypothetical protein [Hoylesella loescheii]